MNADQLAAIKARLEKCPNHDWIEVDTKNIRALLDALATAEARIELKDSQIDQLMRTLKDWQGHINQLEAALREMLEQWAALDIALTLQVKESGIASLSRPIADQRHKMLMVADIARAALQGADDAHA